MNTLLAWLSFIFAVKPALIHFLATWGVTPQAVNINILSPYKVVMANVFIHTSSRDGLNGLASIWLCFCPPDEFKSNIHSHFSSVFGLHQLLWEISVSLAANSSTNCRHTAFVLLDVGQVVYSRFICLFFNENSDDLAGERAPRH